MILFIVGLPGVGKTYFAQKLAEILNYAWLDLDQVIEEKERRTITEIFSQDGESGFRTIEAQQLRRITQTSNNLVIASGGGTPCYEHNMVFMLDQGICIWLKGGLDKIVEQILSDKESRPMFLGLNEEEVGIKLSKLRDKRKGYYQQTHIITGVEAVQKPQLLTNRVELFTKKGNSLNDIIEID